MQQYLTLLKEIKEKGTRKPAARANMPGTISLFGYQFRHDLADGFPLLTTKNMYWKGVVTELLWFLRGDTNIKYLMNNGVNIWNEDAYQYYLKLCKQQRILNTVSFTEFIFAIKNCDSGYPQAIELSQIPDNYILGDCGYQYGRVWRNGFERFVYDPYARKNKSSFSVEEVIVVDQIKNLIEGLKNNPESRRHIVTAIDPAHDTDLALFWCHAMFQFNCRPLTARQREDHYASINNYTEEDRCGMNPNATDEDVHQLYDQQGIPKYYLDCQLYQRSADVVLGVPFNIASYALLTHIIAGICNMIPGEFIHTFGDVHIYENHFDGVEEQLKREPRELPKLNEFGLNFEYGMSLMQQSLSIDEFIKGLFYTDFTLSNYNAHPAIKAELSTGLKQ